MTHSKTENIKALVGYGLEHSHKKCVRMFIPRHMVRGDGPYLT